MVIFLTGQLLETPVLFLSSLPKPAAVSLNRITAPGACSLYPGLGLVMMACALLLRLPRWTWCLTAALCVVATNSLLPADGRPGPLWQAILLAPGLSQHVIVIYPVLPWLAGAAAGMCFGHWWKSNPSGPRVLLLGMALLLAGVALRAVGGWGNIRPPRDVGRIEFLNNVKYPPSLVFWLLSLGTNLSLLALFTRLPARNPLIVFGQTPLFFYLAHLYLLTALAFAFFRQPVSLEPSYLVWAAVVAALYPACVWYRGFKISKPPESLWRLF